MTKQSLKDYEEARTGSEIRGDFQFLSCLDQIHILVVMQQPQCTFPWKFSKFNVNLAYFASKLQGHAQIRTLTAILMCGVFSLKPSEMITGSYL